MTSSKFSPTDFMRARRPELYSDTVFSEEPVLSRTQFEFHLDTITQRKEEIRFEHFCRRLAEKELCPNLLPQTGPTGGGDSKVDAETYPVANTISERWYEGDPMRAAQERWAFAFSAKKKWRPKAKDDVRKILGTGRNYSVIYFMTNQAVSDRDRAAVEDELRKQWNVDVRVLDRTWIMDKVFQHHRWDVVFQTLDVDPLRFESKATCGPLDAKRKRDLDELDGLIQDQTRYLNSEYQLVEDCLQAALLARGLGRPRAEIDGRFDQAERIARKRNDLRQVFRIVYQRAWTANWWFDDFTEFDRLFKIAEPLVINSEWVWDLEYLVNLWQVGNTWRQVQGTLHNDEDWTTYTKRLREALLRHASMLDKPTSALWARTELVLMDLLDAAIDRERLPSVIANLRDILEKAEGHIDYPVEPVVRIVQELGHVAADDETYDELFEAIIQLQNKRVGEAEQGKLRLERGFQKLDTGKTYDAINEFTKAICLLGQDEHKKEFVQSVVGAAMGYEAAGLLWAARANLIVALDRTLYEYAKGGQIAPQALPLIRKLVWVEMQLGRVPCVLVWIEWLGLISRVLELNEEARKRIEEEFGLMDVVLGILVLRTRFADWPKLNYAAGILEHFSLFMARGAALFSLGYEDMFRTEYRDPDGDLDKFFSQWLEQPAAADLPIEAEWHLDDNVVMRTVIMGCEISLEAENNPTSILMGEGILAFLESFLSTAVKLKRHYSARPYLKMEIKEAELSGAIIRSRVEEDDCGETHIVILHPKTIPSRLVQDSGYQHSLSELLAIFVAELQVPFSLKSLEELFSKDRAQDRAFWAAQSPLALTNVLTDKPKYRLQDWVDESITECLKPKRNKPWKASQLTDKEKEAKKEADTAGFTFAEGPPPDSLFGIDGLKHRDLRILSPINMPLWDKAQWRGLGFAICPEDPPIPELILAFKDFEAGKKIFRGWRKRLGEIDHDEWVGITIITGIHRHYPAHYRVAISVNEQYLCSRIKKMERFLQVHRMQDMEPTDSTNLDRFLYIYKKFGRYRLAPGFLAAIQSMPPYASDLSIEKRRLRVVPAWQIGPNDPACAAMKGIEDPVIHPDIVDPPFEKLRKFMNEMIEKSNGPV